MTKEQRKKAIIKRRILMGICVALLALLIILIVAISGELTDGGANDLSSDSLSSLTSSEGSSSADNSSRSEGVISSAVSSNASSKPPVASSQSTVNENKPVKLDPDYSRLILVNSKNPLPRDYNYEGNLMKIPGKYLNGARNQIDKDIWPYTKAMVEAAWADGVKLYILSPYRSYASQEVLFQNKIKRVIASGTPADKAPDEAATVVARPGTSEHHTGLAIDFNSVEDSFSKTPEYRWLKENAENYGFIMRYEGDKQDITGVIHESWHYRFVGIKHAKEINKSGLCLEEYIEKISK